MPAAPTPERYYDRIAHRYDDMYDTPYWDLYRRVSWEHVKPLLPRERSRILDIGGGTGIWAVRLAAAGHDVVCADLSHKMVDVARQKAEREGLADRVTCVRSDLQDLREFGEGEFAMVWAQGDPLSYVPDPPLAVKNVSRVLRPGGLFVASVDSRYAAVEHFLERGRVAELELFIRTGKDQWLADRPEERFPVTFFAPDDLRKMLDRRGFEVVSMIGKTVLPIRKHEKLLDDPAEFRRLLALELDLNRDPALLGGAGHLEVAARKRP
ncbi:MAG: methyltransferase domain-containing protein [Planctomycetia bacterium]|nr:methyltransferase domain-containing protein [Planctomycetia bacterium]